MRLIPHDVALARPTRRLVLLGAAALATVPVLAWADEEVIDLEWNDLLPDGDGQATRTLREIGIVEHGELSTGFEQPTASGVTTAFDGKVVRLPGFMVPIEYTAVGVTTFILVPYVGACIHVPPPPANQLVLVTTEEPYDLESLFDPVVVTGPFSTAATSTDLADVGYAIAAETVEPYRA